MRAWIFIFQLVVVSSAFSDEINPSYSAGLKSYQESKFEQAKASFQTALQEEPQNPLINYNLGLTEWKLGHLGMSLGLLRRAQYSDPSFREALKAETFVREGLKVKDLPHQISLWETLRQELLKPVSMDALLVVTMLLLFISGYTIPKYLGARRRALEDESPTMPNPFTGGLSGLLLIAVVVISGMKLFDLRIQRATVVVQKVEARSGPEPDSSTLFELFEGLEVIVRRSFLDSNQREWVQVTYPGGMTGWISSNDMISHSEWKPRIP